MGEEAMGTTRTGGRASVLAELATAVRARSVSAAHLVETSLERIAGAADLNAVVALRPTAALLEAEEIDVAVRGGSDPGPLAGLPLLVKDIERAAGLPTTYGSVIRANDGLAVADGVVAGQLRRAGAILVGKTNVPEFAFEGYTANRVFGPTRNPWQPALSPGGSSGGSAAALAAGLAPLVTATDVGGSIRIPAALCGLVGLKPTAGLIGRDPDLASLDLNNHGPLTTTVADARLLLELLRGPTPGDFGSLPRSPVDQRAMPARILVAERFVPGPPLPDSVSTAFRAAADDLARAVGARMQTLESSDLFPGGFDAGDWFRIVGVEQAHALGRDAIEANAELFDPVFFGYMQEALAVTADAYAGARSRRSRYAGDLDVLLDNDAVLAIATLTVDGWSADGRLTGRDDPGLPNWVFNTEPPNLTGHPAISLPAGHLPNGLPFGLQLVGPRFSDWLLLDIAAMWEAARPWPLAAPGYPPFTLSAMDASRKRTPRATRPPAGYPTR